MAAQFKVGTASASSGEIARGAIEIGRGFDGPVEIPVIVLRGAKDGPVLWVDGATHGDEPEGTFVCWNLAREVNPDSLSGTLVLAPIVHMSAMKNLSRGNPLDPAAYDLNRVYPGKADGWPTERLAYAYFQECSSKANAVVSVHSGGAASYLDRTLYYNSTPRSLDLAKAFGPEWDLLLKPSYTAGPPDEKSGSGSLGSMLATKGIPSLTPEQGGLAGALPDHLRENVRKLTDGCLNVLRYLEMLPGQPNRSTRWKLAREWLVLAQTGGFWIAEPSFRFRQFVKEGTVLARIVDAYGETLEEIRAPVDGETNGMHANHTIAYPGIWCVFFAEILEEVSA